MTMDKSLRVRGKGIESRSVLSRAERLTQLKASERWHEGDSPFGLPKVRVFKMSIKKKKKAKAEEGAEGAAPAAGATAAAATAGKGAAAPAAGKAAAAPGKKK